MLSPGNTKGGSITVPMTSCLTDLDQSVLQIKIKIVSCLAADSKPDKQEVNSTVILPPLVFPTNTKQNTCSFGNSPENGRIQNEVLRHALLGSDLIHPQDVTDGRQRWKSTRRCRHFPALKCITLSSKIYHSLGRTLSTLFNHRFTASYLSGSIFYECVRHSKKSPMNLSWLGG